jgi:hypothetical protein
MRVMRNGPGVRGATSPPPMWKDKEPFQCG